jgi:HSP20 family protein
MARYSRSYGRFEQRISLPARAKADTVQAKLANGVLSLTFPKGEEAKPRRIALKAE